MKHLLLCLLLAACGGEAFEAPATCTQVGSSYTYGKGTTLRYSCDKDPGEGCWVNERSEFECPAALTLATIICEAQ